MPRYYTQNGTLIRNPDSYAKTAAPMYKTKNTESTNINQPHYIYKINCSSGKKYIGKTSNIEKRLNQHFTGNGSKVTQKFKPKSAAIIDSCPGYFSTDLEQYHTDKNINKHGYENVRGGKYTNSNTLHKTKNNQYTHDSAELASDEDDYDEDDYDEDDYDEDDYDEDNCDEADW